MKTITKYTPKKTTQIAFTAIICFGILLTIGRWYSVFDPNFVFVHNKIHSHISNFSLSMLFYLAVGYMWLLSGVKFRAIILLGLFIIAANFICETLMGFMNTTDIIDAIYGVFGTLTTFVFLFFTNKSGLIKEKNP